ncbi:MAG: hypothetical protein RIS75_1180 [Actinomycetota bacterium]
MSRLEVGDVFPNFRLKSADGTDVSLKDFSGSTLIVYVYPAASTPGCTKQACDFRDTTSEWKKDGYRVVGISPDSIEKLANFRDSDSLNFPLLSDPDKSFMTAIGAFGEKKLYGKIATGVIRSTFILKVEASGKAHVLHAFYNVKATGHVAKLRKDLGLSS